MIAGTLIAAISIGACSTKTAEESAESTLANPSPESVTDITPPTPDEPMPTLPAPTTEKPDAATTAVIEDTIAAYHAVARIFTVAMESDSTVAQVTAAAEIETINQDMWDSISTIDDTTSARAGLDALGQTNFQLWHILNMTVQMTEAIEAGDTASYEDALEGFEAGTGAVDYNAQQAETLLGELGFDIHEGLEDLRG